MFKKTLMAGAAAIGFMAITSSAQALLIDDFNTGTQGLDLNTASGFVEDLDAAASGAAGGFRDLTLAITSNLNPGQTGTSNDVPITDGPTGTDGFAHSTDTGVVSFSRITWNGSGDTAGVDPTGGSSEFNLDPGTSTAGGLGADISGDTAFVVAVTLASRPATWDIVMYDADGTRGSATVLAPVVEDGGTGTSGDDPNIPRQPPLNVFASFASFSYSGAGITDFDFTDVFSISLTGNSGTGSASLDTSVDLIATVPEPATMLLFGTGLLGLGLARRRRKAS